MTENTGKATEAILAQLHGALAAQWLKKLKEAPQDLAPAELNAIRQFLKDNNISCDPSQNAEIINIVDLLPEFSREEALEL